MVLQPGPVLALPLSSWYSELSVALSILRKVVHDPSAAAEWLLAVNSSLTSSQRLSPSLTLIVTHLLITGEEDVCQLVLNVMQAIAAADPCQVVNPTFYFVTYELKSYTQPYDNVLEIIPFLDQCIKGYVLPKFRILFNCCCIKW